MPCCAVVSCKIHTRKTKNSDIQMHRFPKDEKLRKKWILFCRRKKSFSFKYACVCSQHFKPDDYERDLRSELLGLESKKRLKKGSIPSLYLGKNASESPFDSDDPSETVNREREKRKTKREIRKRALERVAYLSPKRNESDNETSESAKMSAATAVPIKMEPTFTSEVGAMSNTTLPVIAAVPVLTALPVIFTLPKGNNHENRMTAPAIMTFPSQEGIRDSVASTSSLNVEKSCIDTDSAVDKSKFLLEQVNILTRQNIELRRKLRYYLKRNKQQFVMAVNQRVKDVFGKVFSEKQIESLCSGKKIVNWDKEDIERALALRAMSSTCYEYLQKEMNIPLPSASTLKRFRARERKAACTESTLETEVDKVLKNLKNEEFEQ